MIEEQTWEAQYLSKSLLHLEDLHLYFDPVELYGSDRVDWYNPNMEDIVRVWCIHPKHLDNQRLLAQHQEIHTILGYMRACMYAGREVKGVAAEWWEPLHFACLCHLHDFIANDEFEVRNFEHKSPLLLNHTFRHRRQEGLNLSWNYGKKWLNEWPPPFVSDKRIIADLMDLQFRWQVEGKLKEYDESVRVFGTYPGGKGKGDRTAESGISIDHLHTWNTHYKGVK